MKQKIIFTIFFIIFLTSFGFIVNDNIYLKISQSIDTFGKVYKEIVAHYVDEVDPEKFMQAGIDGMLKTLDPYTVYIDEQQHEEIEFMTTGHYGGIGISIGFRDGYLTVIAPMEGYAAQKQGIRAGDKILEIDGVSIVGVDFDTTKIKVRGEPGTTVKMKIQREGENQPLEFVLVREEIQVNNVSYSGFLTEGIGYINVEKFSQRAGEEVKQAIKEMKAKQSLKGLIVDVRGNPGGLLEEAVEIVNKFVSKGSTIVTTRGRENSETKTYTAQDEPLLPDVPLIILTNNGSASASEIVAGAIQDLDRGVILGTRSFGKGLVQAIVPFSYNTSMKITTARYYTPSGRSIQEIDYLHKNKDGVFIKTPDSLKHEYKTLSGRIVKDFGGITPDTIVQQPQKSIFYQELMKKAMMFNFATTYLAKHPTEKEIVVDEKLLQEFEHYLTQQKFEYQSEVEKKLSLLEESMKTEKYDSTIFSSINKFRTEIKKEKNKSFERSKNEILQELQEEFSARTGGEKKRIELLLQKDIQVQTAVKILSSKKEYEKILKRNVR